jgi:hypothetical protein
MFQYLKVGDTVTYVINEGSPAYPGRRTRPVFRRRRTRVALRLSSQSESTTTLRS